MEVNLLSLSILRSKVFLITSALLILLSASGCNKNEASIGIAKLVGFKVLDRRVDVDSGQSHHSFVTAKHTGSLWTYIKVNNSTPVQATLMSEVEYEKFLPSKASESAFGNQGNLEELVKSSVEEGKKYYLVVRAQPKSHAPADVSIESYFLEEK